jgi:hypothetical protein
MRSVMWGFHSDRLTVFCSLAYFNERRKRTTQARAVKTGHFVVLSRVRSGSNAHTSAKKRASCRMCAARTLLMVTSARSNEDTSAKLSLQGAKSITTQARQCQDDANCKVKNSDILVLRWTHAR